MKDLLKRTILTGIGYGAMSKEKIEEFAKGLVKDGKFAEDEGKKFVKELLETSDNARKEFETKVTGLVRTGVEKFTKVQENISNELKDKINKLEKRLDDVEKKNTKSE
jgi:polyhydroxyalkanoate synthesis regulator phasin